MGARLRRYLIAGLIFWLPLWVTWVCLSFVIRVMDKTVSLLPKMYQPEQLLGVKFPGFGIFLSIFILLITGIVVSNFLGKRLLGWWELALNRIPLVRTVYSGVKQVLNSLLSPDGKTFGKVLLIEYPRPGIWSIAFQTGLANDIKPTHLDDDVLVTAFIPTTPNPTAGFLVLVPRKNVQELGMSVEDGLKLVISLGVVHPSGALSKG